MALPTCSHPNDWDGTALANLRRSSGCRPAAVTPTGPASMRVFSEFNENSSRSAFRIKNRTPQDVESSPWSRHRAVNQLGVVPAKFDDEILLFLRGQEYELTGQAMTIEMAVSIKQLDP